MVTIIYRVVVKAGKEREFKELADGILTAEALQMPGCLHFSCFQNTADPREFMFYEKWRQHADVEDYKARLIELLGNARPGEEFPAAMNSLIEADEDLM